MDGRLDTNEDKKVTGMNIRTRKFKLTLLMEDQRRKGDKKVSKEEE